MNYSDEDYQVHLEGFRETVDYFYLYKKNMGTVELDAKKNIVANFWASSAHHFITVIMKPTNLGREGRLSYRFKRLSFNGKRVSKEDKERTFNQVMNMLVKHGYAWRHWHPNPYKEKNNA